MNTDKYYYSAGSREAAKKYNCNDVKPKLNAVGWKEQKTPPKEKK